MPTIAYVSHHIPGRMRVRIPSGKGNPGLLDEVKRKAREVRGVASTEQNPATGSILIHYAPQEYPRFFKALSAGLAESISLKEHPPRRRRRSTAGRNTASGVARVIFDVVGGLNEAIREATDDQLDLKVMLPLTMAGGALFTAPSPRRSTPLWMTMMIFAFNSFNTLHRGLEAADEAEAEADASSNGFMA